jgi:hypothetical protein
MSGDDPMFKKFRYEGYDIITLEMMVECEYEIVEPVVVLTCSTSATPDSSI